MPIDTQIIYNVFEKILIDNGCYTNLISLSENKDDYSIKLSNNVIFKIKIKTGLTQISFKKLYLKPYQDINQEKYIIDEISAKSSFVRFEISSIKDLDERFVFLSLLIYNSIISEIGSERFGCCSRYLECSDLKRCTNPNIILSLGCQYKKNLEKGIIFYGMNANIKH